ncbi:MAG: preprotein translocase subunit SecY [Candidatus Aenigmarchaeota archaeon]|nr:preprotein translocase subunit SecY [Candidatus Aenigmarchaeota archaeon]
MEFDIRKIAKFLPAIERPTYKPSLNKKVMWTGICLILYFMMASHFFGELYGINPEATKRFHTLEMLLGSSFGTLMTLGIGPIVTGSILLQLLIGAKIINWDMNEKEDKEKYQIAQKTVSILFIIVESLIFVVSGAIMPRSYDAFTMFIIVLQLTIGGLIVLMMDEIITKHGIGSGISLFIAAGVINQVFISLFSPCVAGAAGCMLPNADNEPVGKVWAFAINAINGYFYPALFALIPILTTILIVVIVAYAQSVTVDVPLAFSAVKGFGRRWSLNLFYTSNMPVILAAALIANVELFGGLVAKPLPNDPLTSCGLLGCFTTTESGNVPTSGIVYYLSSPRTNIIIDAINGSITSQYVLRVLLYTIFFVSICVLFSVFWVTTSGMDSESIAKQIDSIGMQIPGYRKNPKIMKSVLDRYIPPLSVLGGLSIGLLAALADLIGAFGSGTGILLTVTILYSFHQQFKTEEVEGAHPLIKKFVGEEK